ncbi:hypothetical protein N44_00256 [Microcystis aeruginosa NIES-44]|uniref:Uncharacterized protein n=1 Tax=Microcystis aeruginosa NIES-44 TaxID=449439 RepID=A0A0A1VRC2_MICAE|nr:hypothetical protein N44_00256 [Microcystis aeruginosa NIES-44]
MGTPISMVCFWGTISNTIFLYSWQVSSTLAPRCRGVGGVGG